ncbi:hypothetical protein C2G38_2158101 [Gigaspora rosea]|uniref:Uncharacterized protein n=1 Tax=Gigaspora rosea TaxID=44941 RepID=A0A397W0R4_9GLOM|nr:hypothetical protein C2G38_2158101 [Gigaspora rosea]
MWDIEDLSIKTHILVNWKYIPESIKISDDEELLLRLESDDKTDILTVIDYNYRRKKNGIMLKKQLDILPSLKNINRKNFIFHCEILENYDLIIITRIGIFIWTYILEEIQMHYYWNDCNKCLDDFEFKTIKFKTFTENLTLGRILLASTCYGKDHMKALIKQKDDKWIRFLDVCIIRCIENDNYLISKISLLNIIFEKFNELSKNHP